VPFVTIIIPYKSNLKYLFLALKSVFNQNYKNFKLTIVYDNINKNDLKKINIFLKKKIF
jgi:restriction endonuclease S subunit